MRFSKLLSATAFAALLAAVAIPANADQRRGSGSDRHGDSNGGSQYRGNRGGGHQSGGGGYRDNSRNGNGYRSGGHGSGGYRAGGTRYGGGFHDRGLTRYGGSRYGHSRGHWIIRRVQIFDPFPRFVLRRVWDDGYANVDVDAYGCDGYGPDEPCE